MSKKEQVICEGIKWIDIIDPSISEMEDLAREYNLNQNIVKDCMQPEHLPKYEFVDDIHFLILRFFSHTVDKRIATIQDLTNKNHFNVWMLHIFISRLQASSNKSCLKVFGKRTG